MRPALTSFASPQPTPTFVGSDSAHREPVKERGSWGTHSEIVPCWRVHAHAVHYGWRDQAMHQGGVGGVAQLAVGPSAIACHQPCRFKELAKEHDLDLLCAIVVCVYACALLLQMEPKRHAGEHVGCIRQGLRVEPGRGGSATGPGRVSVHLSGWRARWKDQRLGPSNL